MDKGKVLASSLLSKYKHFIFDCDGVLWLGSQRIPHSVELLRAIEDAGKHCYFLTNTSLVSREEIRLKMNDVLGYDIDADRIFTASSLAGSHVRINMSHKKKALVIGRGLLIKEIQATGIEVIDASQFDNRYEDFTYETKEDMAFEEIDLVVMGYDDRINYYKMALAFYAIQKGAELVSTNADRATNSYGYPELKTLGNGSWVACLESASGKKAFVSGKPNPGIFKIIGDIHHIEREDCLFIGDNLETDILFANRAGVDSLLVLTGVTEPKNMEHLLNREGAGKPTFIANDLS
jgi:phosphoglycolate/pyridoxal phosphate phosphatase family enzyme